jgi:hypothetical protein
MFRRTCDIEVLPAEAPARISADSRYVLWVNGQDFDDSDWRQAPLLSAVHPVSLGETRPADLRQFVELSDAVGNNGSASWTRDLYDAAAKGFEDFWDSDRGLYVDHILDEQPRPAASQVAQASAIISGLAPKGAVGSPGGRDDRFRSACCPILGGQRDRRLQL